MQFFFSPAVNASHDLTKAFYSGDDKVGIAVRKGNEEICDVRCCLWKYETRHFSTKDQWMPVATNGFVQPRDVAPRGTHLLTNWRFGNVNANVTPLMPCNQTNTQQCEPFEILEKRTADLCITDSSS